MIMNDELMKEILKYCYQNKIIFEMNKEGKKNKTEILTVDDKKKFIISIPNTKDKKLKKILEDGYNELKKFVE